MENSRVCYLRTISGNNCRKRGCLIWQTGKPHANMSLESDVFYFCGYNCWLVLTFNAGWLILRMKFKKEILHLDKYSQSTARITVYLEEESSGYILHDFSNKIIFLESTIIWCCHETFVSNLIEDLWSRDCLRFLVIEDNPVSTLGLVETQVGCKSNLRFFLTYAGECLNTIADDIWKIISDQSNNYDVKLNCGNSVFYAHKSILSLNSPVFAAMLRSGMTEARTGVVNVHDIESDIFEQFVAFLYTKELLDLTIDSAMQLYRVGDMYAVEWLMEGCSKYLQKNLTLENVWGTLSLADTYNDSGLKEAATAFIEAQAAASKHQSPRNPKRKIEDVAE